MAYKYKHQPQLADGAFAYFNCERGILLEQDGTLYWTDAEANRFPLTEEELAGAEAKRIELDAEWQTAQYAYQRADAYPSIQEQLDMQYWDSVNGTTTWADAIAAVKTEYPKV